MTIAEEAIRRIAALYGIEKEGRGQLPADRASIRQEKAKPLLDELDRWLGEQLSKISSKSELAKAIRHPLTRLPKLRSYLDHGILEIDNNCAERSMRCMALGWKNYLFMGGSPDCVKQQLNLGIQMPKVGTVHTIRSAYVYFGRASHILAQRQRIKRQTIQYRRLLHQKNAV